LIIEKAAAFFAVENLDSPLLPLPPIMFPLSPIQIAFCHYIREKFEKQKNTKKIFGA